LPEGKSELAEGDSVGESTGEPTGEVELVEDVDPLPPKFTPWD